MWKETEIPTKKQLRLYCFWFWVLLLMFVVFPILPALIEIIGG